MPYRARRLLGFVLHGPRSPLLRSGNHPPRGAERCRNTLQSSREASCRNSAPKPVSFQRWCRFPHRLMLEGSAEQGLGVIAVITVCRRHAAIRSGEAIQRPRAPPLCVSSPVSKAGAPCCSWDADRMNAVLCNMAAGRPAFRPTAP